MPINVFALPQRLRQTETPAIRARNQSLQKVQLLRLREQRGQQDELLREWGFKPWKRDDRRNRPLRTKTATISFIARQREAEVVRLRCGHGLTFREIGKKLGISHVAAWKRFGWAMENFRREAEYRAKCSSEIDERLRQLSEVEATLLHLPPSERERIFIARGLLPPPLKRPRKRNHKG